MDEWTLLKLQLPTFNHLFSQLSLSFLNRLQPSWTLYIQVMTFEQAEKFRWNPFDLTKVCVYFLSQYCLQLETLGTRNWLTELKLSTILGHASEHNDYVLVWC